MLLELALHLVSGVVGLCWLLLICAPRAKVTARLVGSDAVPLGICVVYTALVLPYVPGIFLQFDTLEHLDAMLDDRRLLLTGMMHFMAYDLMVGRAIVADAQARGVPHLLLVPCLVMSLLLAPIGYVLYRVVRAVSARTPGSPTAAATSASGAASTAG